jgi:hypothetical protein
MRKKGNLTILVVRAWLHGLLSSRDEACPHEPATAYFPLVLLFDALRGLIFTCCWLCESNLECVAKLQLLIFHLLEGFGKLLQNFPAGNSTTFWHPSHFSTTG